VNGILTIPNIISFVRILLVPVFLWLLLGRDDPAGAGWMLGVIGSTDWIDGYLARRLGQVSELGRFLDPLADRLAIGAAVIGGWIAGALPWPIALAIIIRESLVGIGALIVATRARAKIDVRYMGKVATMAIYMAVGMFLIYAGTDHWFFGTVAWTFVIPGLIMYYWVAGQYVMDSIRIIRGGPPGVSSSDQPMEGQ